jgi:deoxyribonuclease V
MIARRRRPLHGWDLTPKEAVALQRVLCDRVETRDRIGRVRTVAGVDVGFEEGGAVTRAAVVVLDFPGLNVLASRIARIPTCFPYVPGLLSFRELPAVLPAFRRLPRPDLVLVDGQGRAHPRRIGIASHLGVWLDVPTIGVGKSRLCGEHGRVPLRRGRWAPLLDGGECIGAVLRSRRGVRPIYVSTGHRVALESAVRLVMACTAGYRLPEPIRAAHRLASG